MAVRSSYLHNGISYIGKMISLYWIRGLVPIDFIYRSWIFEWGAKTLHYNDVIMSAMASQITSFMIVYSTIYSGTDHRKHQSSVSLAFVRGIHLWPVNSPHKGPVTQKMFPFDDVIMMKMKECQATFPVAVNILDNILTTAARQPPLLQLVFLMILKQPLQDSIPYCNQYLIVDDF